mgnify:CR=1 FL=1
MKNWNELEKSSFFDANARERAVGLCDKGTFTELLGPCLLYTSDAADEL